MMSAVANPPEPQEEIQDDTPGSNSELNQDKGSMELGSDCSPPAFVFHRQKRQRNNETSPSSLQIDEFKSDMKELIRSIISEQKKDLEGINNNLMEIQQTNSNIDKSIGILTAQNEEFRKKIQQLESQSQQNREYIAILEDKVEDLQRISRKTSIELKNVPKKADESRNDLINMVMTMSNSINMNMVERDITDIFRLKGKSDKIKNPTIIVEFGSSILRTDFLKKSKDFNTKNNSKLQAKDLGHTTEVDTPVFVAEQLTSKGARLHFLARDLAKTQKYKHCWVSFGRVFVRKNDTSKIIKIQHEAQVQNLLQQEK